MDDERRERTLYNKQRRRDLQRSREIDEAFHALMQHSQGRRAVYWLLDIGGISANPFSGNALQTAFNCGKQDVGQAIQRRVAAASPDFFLTMLKEMENERQSDAAGNTGSSASDDGDTSGDD